MLLTKNLALMVIVGLPTLLLTAAATAGASTRTAWCSPCPVSRCRSWPGSASATWCRCCFPSRPCRCGNAGRSAGRWNRRCRWLAHLGLPYALLYAVDPVGDTPRAIVRTLPRAWRTAEVRGLVILLLGVAIWAAGTAAATWVVRRRGLRIR